MKERRLITSALPYINNVPHLGHIIGCHLPADIFARYCRLKGYETLFVGGTDENGSTSEIAAEEISVDINVFCNKLHEVHKKVYDWFNISYDNFSRTSKKLHHETTQEVFKKVYENGFIKIGKMKVFYSPVEKRFLADRYVKGTCPRCGYEEANGDQCEKCTSVLDATQLINPRSVITNTPLEIRETEHLFLRLDKLSDKLEEWIKERKNWKTQVTNLALGWIKEGLKERCITRDLKHGVKVPLKGFENKVFYVWFDAPIGYISSTKEATKDWEKFWKDKNSKVYHFLGKDNIPFHTIFWPGILMACGEYNLPYHVEGLQYLNFEGGKFSKSKKRGVFCEKLLETNLNSDLIRAYLTFIIPETDDSEFKWQEFQNRINSDIIGNYGNFINRTLSFVYSKFKGEIKKPTEKEFLEIDKNFIKKIEEKVKIIEENFEKINLRNAFLEILSLSSEGNKYFNDNKPWEVIKEDKKRANCVLYLCTNLCKTLAILMFPFLPNSSQKILEQLNLKEKIKEKEVFDNSYKLDLNETHRINKPEILFEKLTDDYINELKEKLAQPRDLREFFK